MKRQLTPSFSIPRLKKNVSTMNDVAYKVRIHKTRQHYRGLGCHSVFPSQLIGYLHSVEDREYVEALDFIRKYYLNCIAGVGFGLNIDCFTETKSSFEKAAE